MAKIKVLRTIETFYPNMTGPAKQAYNISTRISKKGFITKILTTTEKAEKRPDKENIDGILVKRFPIMCSFMRYFYTPKMKKDMLDSGFDIACAHSYRSYQTELCACVARKEGKPFVLHNHGSLMGYRTFVTGFKRLPYLAYDLFHKSVALKADAVTVNTKQELGEVLRFGVSRKKIHLIPVGIDAAKYKPMKKDSRALTLLWVGRITRDRNIEPIIKALRLLNNKNVRLKIVGNEFQRTSGDKEPEIARLKRIASEIGVQEKVEFIPWTNERANKEFRKADIFVYTSLWENFGQSILEAAAAGLPLICSRVGVALDLIDNGKTGRLVGHSNPKAIAKAVEEFSAKKKRQTAEKKLRHRVEKEYTWEKIIESYIKLYKSLI